MEDKRIHWNADEFFGADGFKELNLDDLNGVAGGRGYTINERMDYIEITHMADDKYDSLTGKEREEYNEKFQAALRKWMDDIRNAPEGSPDILFSTYIQDLL